MPVGPVVNRNYDWHCPRHSRNCSRSLSSWHVATPVNAGLGARRSWRTRSIGFVRSRDNRAGQREAALRWRARVMPQRSQFLPVCAMTSIRIDRGGLPHVSESSLP
jgi:hypothetical protein